MRIIEVRDGFIKIEATKNLSLSTFLEIVDNDRNYIAQIQQIKNAGDYVIAYAKCMFLYDGDLHNYDKTLPGLNSEVREFKYEELSKHFDYKFPIAIGTFIDSDSRVLLERSFLNKKTLISVDKKENVNNIFKNLLNQFEKSLIIDTTGIIEGKKYVAGKDFKLPLNTEALNFIFEDCLNDATSDSKALIKEIFQDLSDYSRTVPFLPFGTLKTIVDDMVDKSHVFKLLVLKNKLAKFEKLGYFAANANEAENLNKILDSNKTIIDLSKLDPIFMNRYLSAIYSTFEKVENSSQVFLYASNCINKKNLKNFLTGNIKATFVTHSRFKFINEIKSMFTNFIIESNFANNENFKKISGILPQLKKDLCLIIGEGTSYIPFVSKIELLQFSNILSQENTNVEVQIKDVDLPLSLEEIEDETIETEDLAITEEKDEAIIAIDKKSEELIEKVSEEIQNEEVDFGNDIFSDDSDVDDELEDVVDSKFEEGSLSVESETFTNLDTVNEYHTEVDETKIIEVSEDVSFIIEEDTQTPISKEEDIIIEENSLEINETEQIDFAELEEVGEVESSVEAVELADDKEEVIEFSSDMEDFVNVEQENDDLADFISEATEVSEIIDNSQDFVNESVDDFINEKEISESVDENFVEDELDAIEADGDLIELDSSELPDDLIVIDIDENEDENSAEDIDKAIVEDVDKVFTTMKEDTISDSDLDFIDELNNSVSEGLEETIEISNDIEELTDYVDMDDEEDSFLQPLDEVNDFSDLNDDKEVLETRNSSTPMVPVYGADIPAEDMVMSDSFEQGDTVYHAKYGNGVVEKMIKYGAKSLYSINFDNVGRRLLDPTLTEIKKA